MKNSKKEPMTINHDRNWKTIIERLFPEFIAFFLGGLYDEIDFSVPPQFLEQELHKIVADKIQKGKVISDKLILVRLKNGKERLILIHIEIQGSDESEFPRRMYIYFYRILDRYDQKMVTLAVYTGNKIPKNYNSYSYDFFGTELHYKFNTYVAKDATEKDLIQSDNPFALVILAVKYLHQQKNPNEEQYKTDTYNFKKELIRLCREKSKNNQQIISLFEFINLTIHTPKELEEKFMIEATEILMKKGIMKDQELEDYYNLFYKAIHGKTPEEMVQSVVANNQEVLQKNQAVIKRLQKEKEMAIEKFSAEKIAAVANLLKKSDLSVDMIAEILNFPKEKVLEIQRKMEEEK